MITSRNRRFFLNVLLLVVVLIGSVYAVMHYDISRYFLNKEQAIAFIKSFHPYDEIVFITLQILQVVLAPIPGEATGIIGGYLYGPLLGTIYSTIGLTIGSWLAFVIARIFGLPLVERMVKPEIIRKYDCVMENRGPLISFVLFLIPGFPKDCLCYILGLSHITTGAFVVISMVGRLLGTVLLSMSGGMARNNHYGPLMVLSAAGLIFVLIGYIYRERFLNMLKKGK